MRRRSVDELLFHMPWLSRRATDPWERQFAASMAKKGRFRNWQPTQRQRQVMERLVAELFDGGGSAEVIER